jgi:hypothetical protein
VEGLAAGMAISVPMIAAFKDDMANWSFKRNDRRSFVRQNGCLWWWIDELPYSNGDPRVRVGVGIGIEDPFREDNGFGLACLIGDVEPKQICFHFDVTPFWWDPADFAAVRSVLAKCWLPALTHWTVLELINYFENPPANVTFAREPSRAVVPTFDWTKVTLRPPIHHLWLSLLHYHQRDYQRSLFHSEEWLKTVGSVKDGGTEPKRTLDQIVALRSLLRSAG